MLKSVLSWSGGKDSTASIILAHDNGIQIDKIIMSEVMFSHEENISAEDEEHINWVYNYALPLFLSWGYDVEILRDKDDYLSLFYGVIGKKGNPQNQNKLRSFPLGGRCQINDRLKMRPIRKYLKQNCDIDTISYQGIAIGELVYDKKTKQMIPRLERMHKRNKNAISLLEQFNYTEKMAFALCAERGLLSPIYLRHINRRQGCWFCPNRSIAQFAELRELSPDKWQRLVDLSNTPNLCSYGFKWGLTVQEVEKKMDLYVKEQEIAKRQISIEEYYREEILCN